MFRPVIASAPGRVCWYGDHVDWISGPAIVSALEPLRVFVMVQPIMQAVLSIQSLNVQHPNGGSVSLEISDPKGYGGGWYEYVRAATAVMRRRYKFPGRGLKISVNTTFPIGAGLSSSAALSVACIHALAECLGRTLSPRTIARLAYEAENQEQGIPCGQMDQYASALGGMMYVDCAQEPPMVVERFAPSDGVRLLVVDSGEQKRTDLIITALRRRISSGDQRVCTYVATCEQIIREARTMMQRGAWNLDQMGHWLNTCQNGIRDQMLVSTPTINTLCNTAMSRGALGAKLSGSGGGGAMFALCEASSVDKVSRAMHDLGVRVYPTSISQEGVRSETMRRWVEASLVANVFSV